MGIHFPDFPRAAYCPFLQAGYRAPEHAPLTLHRASFSSNANRQPFGVIPAPEPLRNLRIPQRVPIKVG